MFRSLSPTLWKSPLNGPIRLPLTNDENVIKSSILVTDITDHMPTVLTTRNNLTNHSGSTKKITYKRIHTDDNIAKFTDSQLAKMKKSIPDVSLP